MAEVSDARTARLLVALELHDLVAAIDGGERNGSPDDAAADDRRALPHGQGSVYSFTVVMPRTASTTPSLTPRPDDLMPPNGVSSVR